jgi:hypothetical protein
LEVKYAHMHGVFYVCAFSLSLYESLLLFFFFVKIRFFKEVDCRKQVDRCICLHTRVNVTKSVMDDHDFMV